MGWFRHRTWYGWSWLIGKSPPSSDSGTILCLHHLYHSTCKFIILKCINLVKKKGILRIKWEIFLWHSSVASQPQEFQRVIWNWPPYTYFFLWMLFVLIYFNNIFITLSHIFQTLTSLRVFCKNCNIMFNKIHITKHTHIPNFHCTNFILYKHIDSNVYISSTKETVRSFCRRGWGMRVGR